MPLVERRYAEAFISLSEQQAAIDIYQQELREIADIYVNQSEFREFLLNPQIRVDVKKEAIKKMFEGNVRTEMLSLLLLLLDKGRIKYLPGILREYNGLADKKKNVLNMTIVSTDPLENGQVEAIKEKYRRLYGASQVKAEFELDKELIGGVKVKIGDKVMDGTIKGRLESLRKLIVEI